VVMGVCGGGEGGGGDVAVGGDAEADGLGAACGGQVGLGEFAVRGGEADAESSGFAGPSFAFCFGDAGEEVVADFFEAVALGGVDAEEGASDAGVLVDAGCRVCASAVAECDAAALEVAEELFPFGVGRGAVFLAGPGGPAAGDERPVAVDGFLGVDGFISHGGVYVVVAEYQLGDVRRHAVEDGVGGEDPLEFPNALNIGDWMGPK
jgi:hypothetical protein